MDFGALPDYLVILSVAAAVAGLIYQRKTEHDRTVDERNRQARLADLQRAWDAATAVAGLPGALDNPETPTTAFDHALRQIQLTANGPLLQEALAVVETMVTQGERREAPNVDLAALIEALRCEYRELMNIEQTDLQYAPFHIVPSGQD